MAYSIRQAWAVVTDNGSRYIKIMGVFPSEAEAEAWARDHYISFDELGTLVTQAHVAIKETTVYSEWPAKLAAPEQAESETTS